MASAMIQIILALEVQFINLPPLIFFTVPTVTFQILSCFIVLRHDQRRIVHFNITTNPTSQWTAQQIKEASPYDQSPKYLIRDRDAIYGHIFQNRVKNMGINEVVTAPKSP
jgi:hypothetical protein